MTWKHTVTAVGGNSAGSVETWRQRANIEKTSYNLAFPRIVGMSACILGWLRSNICCLSFGYLQIRRNTASTRQLVTLEKPASNFLADQHVLQIMTARRSHSQRPKSALLAAARDWKVEKYTSGRTYVHLFKIVDSHSWSNSPICFTIICRKIT